MTMSRGNTLHVFVTCMTQYLHAYIASYYHIIHIITDVTFMEMRHAASIILSLICIATYVHGYSWLAS